MTIRNRSCRLSILVFAMAILLLSSAAGLSGAAAKQLTAQLAAGKRRNVRTIKSSAARFDPRVALAARTATGKRSWVLRSDAFDRLSGAGQRAALVINGLLKPPASPMPGRGGAGGNARGRRRLTALSIGPLDNVQVDDPAFDITDHTHSETSIAANGQNIIETYNDSDFVDLDGYAYSTDGGHSFTPSRTTLDQNGSNMGDGVVVAGPSGEFYHSDIALQPAFGSPFLGNMMIGVSKSTDNGVSFSPPVNASTTLTNDIDLQDKPWITVDKGASSPNRGNVYVSWTDFSPLFLGETIFVARSIDGAASFEAPIAISPGNSLVQGSMPAVAPDGTLYVAYIDETNIPATMHVVKSTDAGQTFTKPVAAATLLPLGVTTGIDSVRCNSFPSITVSGTGAVHIVYDAQPVQYGADRSDIMYVKSTDGGATFSSPKRVNDDNTTTTQFLPSIAAAADGSLGVKWWDRRNDPGNDSLTDVYMTISHDDGATFGANFRITNQNWTFGQVEPGFATAYHGDYDDITADGGSFYVSWSDERNGHSDAFVSSLATGSTAGPDFNISAAQNYTAVTAGGTATIPINTSAFNGLSGQISLSAGPQIPGVALLVSPSVAAGTATQLTVETNATAHSGTYLVTVSGTSGGVVRKTSLKLNVYNTDPIAGQPADISNGRGFASIQGGLQVDKAGVVHMVYDDDSLDAGGGSEIMYARSTDGGNSYSRPVAISSPAANSTGSTLAIGASGLLAAAWTSTDPTSGKATIMTAASSNGGATFSSAVAVSGAGNVGIPAVGVDKSGTILCGYLEVTSQVSSEVLISRSTDGGKTFSTPVRASGGSQSPDASGIGIAFDSTGTGYVVYVDDAAPSPTVNLVTTAGGQTFSQPQVVSDNTVQTLSPAVAIDASDNVYVAYAAVFEDLAVGINPDIVISRSCDHGRTFNPAVNVSNNPGESLFPSIAADAAGNVALAWEDTTDNPQADIFVASSSDGGITFSRPVNISANEGLSLAPSAAFDSGGNLVVAWSDDSPAKTDILGTVVAGLPPGPSDFALVPAAAEAELNPGQKGTLTVLISRSGGFSGGGLPSLRRDHRSRSP